MKREQSRAYINDFLYFVIKQDKDALICYSGVNVDRFTPITKGRHNTMANPAIRGLQLIQYDIMALALKRGTNAKPFSGSRDSSLPPTREFWATDCLRIKNAPLSFADTIIDHCVVELLNKIDKGCTLEAALPDTVLSSEKLQTFIESLCDKYTLNPRAFDMSIKVNPRRLAK